MPHRGSRIVVRIEVDEPMTWLLALPVIWLAWRWYLLIDRWVYELRGWWHSRRRVRAGKEWKAIGYAEVRPGMYVRENALSWHRRSLLKRGGKLRWSTICRGDRELNR
jgi:hypothetical protein